MRMAQRGRGILDSAYCWAATLGFVATPVVYKKAWSCLSTHPPDALPWLQQPSPSTSLLHHRSAGIGPEFVGSKPPVRWRGMGHRDRGKFCEFGGSFGRRLGKCNHWPKAQQQLPSTAGLSSLLPDDSAHILLVASQAGDRGRPRHLDLSWVPLADPLFQRASAPWLFPNYHLVNIWLLCSPGWKLALTLAVFLSITASDLLCNCRHQTNPFTSHSILLWRFAHLSHGGSFPFRIDCIHPTFQSPTSSRSQYSFRFRQCPQTPHSLPLLSTALLQITPTPDSVLEPTTRK
nr:hypothetical protein L203_05517 [Cryptococcus depauperatus CBS 7841]